MEVIYYLRRFNRLNPHTQRYNTVRNARLSQQCRIRPKSSAILWRVTIFSEGHIDSLVRVNQSAVLGLPDYEDEGNPSITIYQ